MSELAALDESIIQSQMVGQQQPQQVQTHGVYVEFYMHPTQDMERSAEEGRPIFEELPYVMIMAPGDKSSVVRRPVRTGHGPKDDNNRFYHEYQAFLTKKDQPLQGTPLAQWPQITRAQCMELEALNVRTVENLAEMADGYASQYMGLMDLKHKASKWLEVAKSEAPVSMMQEELKERDNRLAAQDDAIAELTKELAALKKPGKAKAE